MTNLEKHQFLFTVVCIKRIPEGDPTIPSPCPPNNFKLDDFNAIMSAIPQHLGSDNRIPDRGSGDLALKDFKIYAGFEPGTPIGDLPSGTRYDRVVFSGLAEGTIFSTDANLAVEMGPGKGSEKFNIFLDEIFEQPVRKTELSEITDPNQTEPFMDTSNVANRTFAWVIFRLPKGDLGLGSNFIMGGEKGP